MAVTVLARSAVTHTGGTATLVPFAPFTRQPDDILFVTVRANRGLSGSGFSFPSGWKSLGVTLGGSEPAAGFFYKTNLTQADVNGGQVFSGWAHDSNTRIITLATVVRGIKASAGAWNSGRNSTGAVAERIDALRGNVDIMSVSFTRNPLLPVPEIEAPEGWELAVSYYDTPSSSTADRSGARIYYRENTSKDSALLRRGTFSVSGPTRNPRYHFTTFQNMDTPRVKPPTQPFNRVYVGENEAILWKGDVRLW